MGCRAVIYSWSLSCIIFLLALHPQHTKAGLLTRSRLAREIYPEIEPNIDDETKVCFVGDVVYTAGESVPADQPCLKCKCQPPGVHCETVRCAKKSGCKVIHRPHKCCPDYQCECIYEDKVYANGERLNTSSGNECKVCYCRGGEIQCTQVSCYVRTDCEAKKIPGQCCPKYENCPPIEKSKPQITIQEIIPEKKEVTQTVTEKNKDSGNNDLFVVDSEPESSEISEVFQQPPSVLRIGDKLLFLNPEKNQTNPTSIITIIGAEGLQRGIEESSEFDSNSQLFNNSNDLEPKVAESSHILSLVKHKPKSTTEIPETTTLSSKFGDIEIYTESELEAETVIQNSTEVTYDTLLKESPTYLPEIKEISEEETTTRINTEETTLKNEDSEKLVLDSTTIQSDETTDFSVEENVTSSRSMESLEETTEESGEYTTQKNHASVISTENASVENTEYSETEDMMKASSEVSTSNPLKEEIELINTTEVNIASSKSIRRREDSPDSVSAKSIGKSENEADLVSAKSIEKKENSPEDEAGLVSAKSVRERENLHEKEADSALAKSIGKPEDEADLFSARTIEKRENSPEREADLASAKPIRERENFPEGEADLVSAKDNSPEKEADLVLAKSVGKRENSPEDEADLVFKQLELELNADTTERIQTEEEAKSESDKIFKELLDETSTPKIKKTGKENERLERITDTIAKLTLKEKKNSLDGPNILGVLSNFFSSGKK